MSNSASHPAGPDCPKNGKSGPHCWGRGGSTQFAQQLEFAVTAPPLVGCVVWSHPPMCFKYIKRGPKGCAKGTSCKFVHPKLYHASFVTGKCNRNRCYFYHVTHSKITENSRSSHERASNSNREIPLMNLNLPPYNPPQAKTASINPTHIQHLTQSQFMPSYMAHPYQISASTSHTPTKR